ncbi:MAG: gluconate 2-dehydrogenase subunit 3 family protein [Nitrobacter sp.]
MALRRREFLAGSALLLLSGSSSRSALLSDQLPWYPDAGSPPVPARPGPWLYFTADEARAVEALADRIIPADPQTPGGKDSDCAVFVDRQLAGHYGRDEGHYLRPPFMSGTKQQGPQSAKGPAQDYRDGLAALEKYCQAKYSGKRFPDLTADDQDTVLKGLESGEAKLDPTDGESFFKQVLKDIQAGFFADPLYGGNRDMVAWKMIGYPGARYNYLDWIERHNERYPLPPVGITGSPAWSQKT